MLYSVKNRLCNPTIIHTVQAWSIKKLVFSSSMTILDGCITDVQHGPSSATMCPRAHTNMYTRAYMLYIKKIGYGGGSDADDNSDDDSWTSSIPLTISPYFSGRVHNVP